MPSNYSSKRSNRARAIVKAQLPAPCTICHGIVTADMRWHADHIMQRAFAEAAGWTREQIDAASNLGPAHKSCDAAKNKRPTQTKAQRVESRIPKVVRPNFEKINSSEVFSESDENPGCCPTESLPDCGSEVTE